MQDLNPQNTPVRLSFYNYLKSRLEGNEELSQALLEEYFALCLEYPHWLANKSQLGREILYVLQNMNSFYVHQSFDFQDVRFPQDMQVFEIENTRDAMQASERYIESLCGTFDKYRIVSDGAKKYFALVVRTDRSSEIHQLDRKFTLRNGQLQPLRKNIVLYYDPDFNLKANVTQCCEISPYLLCSFKLNEKSLLSGAFLRGYVFQKLTEFSEIPMEKNPRLQEYVRKLETIFFEKNEENQLSQKQDPLLASEGLFEPKPVEPQKTEFASLIHQAENALKTSFQDDKHLSQLVERFKTYVQSST